MIENINENKFKYLVKTQTSVIDEINKLIKEENPNAPKAIDYLLALFANDEDFPKIRYKIYDFAKELIGDQIPEKKEIKFWDNSIWEHTDSLRIRRLMKIVASCDNIYNLQVSIKKQNIEETIEWLQLFIDFIKEFNKFNYFNNNELAILPNQNKIFKIKDELFLDNGEIDENLKDIATELGYKIKDELLDKNIYFELPENRLITQELVAEEISKLIKPILRDINKREENKDVIRKLYLWMNKNKSIAEQIFTEIYEKRFLLINDEEIIANIEKADILDIISEQTGLTTIEIKDKLIELLNNPQISEILKKGKNEFYPESEDEIEQSQALTDNSDEKSRISISQEAKEIILETLKRKGFIVSPDISLNYTIILGILKPDGTNIKIVVKSGRAGKIYFNPNEWLALTEENTQLFVVTHGNIVRNVTLNDLAKYNDTFHMRFNTTSFAVDTNLSSFANFFQYLPYTHFIFDTPESTTDYLEEFGLNRRNPSVLNLSSDDKNLLK